MRKAKSIQQQREAISKHRKGTKERATASTNYLKSKAEWSKRRRLTPRSERTTGKEA